MVEAFAKLEAFQTADSEFGYIFPARFARRIPSVFPLYFLQLKPTKNFRRASRAGFPLYFLCISFVFHIKHLKNCRRASRPAFPLSSLCHPLFLLLFSFVFPLVSFAFPLFPLHFLCFPLFPSVFLCFPVCPFVKMLVPCT